RPGGVIVFLTSWGTLDKQTRTVRAWLAEQAELIGAFRLPNGVFRCTSGSESACDLLILQKKASPDRERPSWLDLAPAHYRCTNDHRSMTTGSRYTREIKNLEELLETPILVNRLWLDQPERVIGQPQTILADNSLWLHVAPPA